MTGNEKVVSLPLGRGVSVVQEDPNGLMAMEKPAGVLSHPNREAGERRALLTCPYDLQGECYRFGDGESRRLWLLNRLDSATSGILLATTSETMAGLVRRLLSEQKVKKKYYALVLGHPAKNAGVWRDRLTVEKQDGKLRTRARDGLYAETAFRVLQTGSAGSPVALIDLTPKTGRTHQLRVQCAKRKLPIVGDQTYGQFRFNREFVRQGGEKRLFLHSAEAALRYEWNGTVFTFTARSPMPECFRTTLSY